MTNRLNPWHGGLDEDTPPPDDGGYNQAMADAKTPEEVHEIVRRFAKQRIVDQLLTHLVEEPSNVPMALRAAGHTEEEISAAWREARQAVTRNRPGSEWIG